MGNGEVVVQLCLTNQERTTEDSEKRNRKAGKVNETDMGEVETCNKHNDRGNPERESENEQGRETRATMARKAWSGGNQNVRESSCTT